MGLGRNSVRNLNRRLNYLDTYLEPNQIKREKILALLAKSEREQQDKKSDRENRVAPKRKNPTKKTGGAESSPKKKKKKQQNGDQETGTTSLCEDMNNLLLLMDKIENENTLYDKELRGDSSSEESDNLENLTKDIESMF